MKKIYGLVAFIASVLFFYSCDDFMDVHKEYIKGGEIIYAPKPDSVKFIAGKGRVSFYCRTYNATNIHSIDVYWNDGLDSLIIPVDMKVGYDNISVIIDNLKERSYTFNVRTTDKFGHKSLYMTDFGTSYGEIYQSRLTDRRIKNVSLSDKGGVLAWYSASASVVRNELRYEKKDGSQAIVKVPSTTDETLLPDFKTGTEVEFRTLHIPETLSVDTFATAWKVLDVSFPEEFIYDRSSWVVLSASDEAKKFPKSTIIDGDLTTFWHSDWESTPPAPLPHWAVIDMQSSRIISRVEVYRRMNNNNAKSVELYVSDQPDGTSDDWKKIGGGVFPNKASDSLLSIPISDAENAKGRYLKLLLPDSNNGLNTGVAEIYVYGK